jgi:hypothetical protein
LGTLVVHKPHALADCPNGFRMSSYLQELLAYLGSDYVFEEASAVLEKLLGLKISAKQVERVSEKIGHILEEDQAERVANELAFSSALEESQDVYTYVQIDGSMVFTREEKWKELKLGRIFQQSIDELLTAKNIPIKHSEYSGYLGDSTTFLARLKQLIPKVECPIFIADGAPWIWRWIEENYPNSVQILDYYHAMGYVHDFAKTAFAVPEKRKSWIDGVKNYLFTNRIQGLIRHFQYLETKIVGESLEALQKLIRYYQVNQNRMFYGFYKEKNLMIGSGAIEAAHREVVQKRMKLSGQRWSKKGVQAILQLRITKKSAKWNKVINIAKTGKVAA